MTVTPRHRAASSILPYIDGQDVLRRSRDRHSALAAPDLEGDVLYSSPTLGRDRGADAGSRRSRLAAFGCRWLFWVLPNYP